AEPESESPAGMCTVPPSASCAGTAQVVPCAQVETDRGKEQLICCPGVHQFFYRLCTDQPNSVNACGLTGGLGCSVCNGPPPHYDKTCDASVDDGFLTGVYRGTDGDIHHVRIP